MRILEAKQNAFKQFQEIVKSKQVSLYHALYFSHSLSVCFQIFCRIQRIKTTCMFQIQISQKGFQVEVHTISFYAIMSLIILCDIKYSIRIYRCLSHMILFEFKPFVLHICQPIHALLDHNILMLCCLVHAYIYVFLSSLLCMYQTIEFGV